MRIVFPALAAGLLAAAALTGAAEQSFAASKGGKSCAALKAIDPDKDGSIDLKEAQAAAAALFDKLNKDKSKDQTLEIKELQGRLSRADFAAADPDKDGTIDKAEFMKIVETRFAAATPDGDGTVDCKEAATPAGKALMRILK
jgi:Ca2+-binding EF-hand superfamily protein